jgi:hypothetical protein
MSYDPRELWATNVVPFVVAAREGATHAARTARVERSRLHRQPPWWQQRWVVVTACGLAVVGVAGAAYSMMKRRSRSKPVFDEMTGTPARTEGGSRSTIESGRKKVAGATRTMMHKIRREGEASTMEQPTVAERQRRNEIPSTGTGYGSPR